MVSSSAQFTILRGIFEISADHTNCADADFFGDFVQLRRWSRLALGEAHAAPELFMALLTSFNKSFNIFQHYGRTARNQLYFGLE